MNLPVQYLKYKGGKKQKREADGSTREAARIKQLL